MQRVIGIGGVFFKSQNPGQLYEWYEKHLGIRRDAHGQGASFHWRDGGSDGMTVWSLFPSDSDYFKQSRANFMINYRVADLAALITALREEGVAVEGPEDYDYGRFAWLTDPEGNRIELWEPK